MAATTGLAEASMRSTTSGRPGSTGGLPNSVMSAPAKKVLPWPTITTALTPSSLAAAFMASARPWRTAAPSAFTGGLSLTTTSTSPSLWVVTTGIVSLLISVAVSVVRVGRQAIPAFRA